MHTRRIARVIAAVAGLSLSVMPLAVPAASASQLPQTRAAGGGTPIRQHVPPRSAPRKSGWFQIRNRQTGKCLADPHGSTKNGTQLQLWPCNGSPNQNWTFYLVAGCIENWPCEYVFYNENAKKCLEVKNGSKANGAPAALWSCTPSGSTSSQWWVLFSVDNSGYQVYQNISSRTDMTASGTANGSKVQMWNPRKLAHSYFWKCTPGYCA